MNDPREILRRPHITEKTTLFREKENKYAFEVDRRANRIEIKGAVEGLFKVTVLKVTTQMRRGKIRRMGRFKGKRPDWKIAILTLKEGDRIELFEG
ncbi:50S ribosomal protein L23 [candidate division TA06 bacterium]|nr:50S ribosomal protein L23 [candidate division TA06 bacterium]